MSLGEYLAAGGYGDAFRDHHILPMASAIWSATPAEIMAFPAAAFIRFHDNHGLLQFSGRPVWRTVSGGAAEYVSRIGLSFAGRVRYGTGAVRVERSASGAAVVDSRGGRDAFDQVVLACHADEALALIEAPTEEERAQLGAFRYSRNLAVLHTDESLMPSRRAVWSGWNYIGGDERAPNKVSVTYWMNRLQSLPTRTNLFVTLNPTRAPRQGSVLRSETYDHPLFDAPAIAAQKTPLASAGGAERLVLRRVFRFGVPRGRAPGGPRGRRTARRRQASVDGRERNHRASGSNRAARAAILEQAA